MKRILILFIIILTTGAVYGDYNYSGRRAGVFLEQGVGARAVGMGEAYIVLSDDINSVWWNAAGLGGINSYELLFMHDEYIQGIRQEYGAFGFPLKNNYGTIGVSINYLDYGKYDRTTITSGNSGTTTGSFGAKSWVGSIAWGKKFSRINFGFNLKYISDKLDNTKASAFGADIGLQYPASELFTIGYTVQNIGTKLKYESERSSLPIVHRIGLGYRQPGGQINFEADAVKSENDKWQVQLGGELWAIKNRFALRAGYISGRDAEDKYTVGAGFLYNGLSLDYAYSPFGKLGSSHKASIQYKFLPPVK